MEVVCGRFVTPPGKAIKDLYRAIKDLCRAKDVNKGLFIWAKVIPVSEKTFRQVHKRDLALS